MVASKLTLYFAGAVAVASAIPTFLEKDNADDFEMKDAAVKSFVAGDLNGVTFTVMTQYRQGDSNGVYPDECPQMWAITEGAEFVPNAGVVSIPYSRMKFWGNSSGVGVEPADACLDDGHGRLELAESSLLQGGQELDELRESFVDISQIFDKTDEEIASGTVVDEVRRLHQSVWLSLKGKQYFTGKVDYEFRTDDKQKELLGIKCHGQTFFKRGELMLFIDEPQTIRIQVKTAVERTSQVTLLGNRRYAIVTTPDSTCLYRVDADKDPSRDSNVDKNGSLELPRVCQAGCVCQC